MSELEDQRCPCGPCTTKRRVIDWAQGNVAERPSDVDIKWMIVRYAIEAARRDPRTTTGP